VLKQNGFLPRGIPAAPWVGSDYGRESSDNCSDRYPTQLPLLRCSVLEGTSGLSSGVFSKRDVHPTPRSAQPVTSPSLSRPRPLSHPSSGSSKNWSTSPTSSSLGSTQLRLGRTEELPRLRLSPKCCQRLEIILHCTRCDSSTNWITLHITSLGRPDNCILPVMSRVLPKAHPFSLACPLSWKGSARARLQILTYPINLSFGKTNTVPRFAFRSCKGKAGKQAWEGV